jgi:hypothetical protein
MQGEKLTAIIGGWVNYFKLADMKSLLFTIVVVFT